MKKGAAMGALFFRSDEADKAATISSPAGSRNT